MMTRRSQKWKWGGYTLALTQLENTAVQIHQYGRAQACSNSFPYIIIY